MSVARKKRSSGTWRAILFGREALSKGLIKRVGPGNLKIWEENWVTGLGSKLPLIRYDDTQVQWVHQLFIPGTRVWNEPLVRDTFSVFDAEEILKVKPGTRLMEDLLAWAPEKSGCYSVRSCYRLLKREQDQREANSDGESRASEETHWWKRLWKLKILPKVHIFWWRAMNGYLPTKGELREEGILHVRITVKVVEKKGKTSFSSPSNEPLLLVLAEGKRK